MKWLLTCSVDGVNIDFETIIDNDTEPSFWECYGIAAGHGCEWFAVDTLNNQKV